MVKRITKAQKEKRKNIIFAIILGALLTSNSITGYGLYKVSKQNKDLQAQITSLYNNVKSQNTKNDYLEDDGVIYFVMRKDHGVKSMIKELENKYMVNVIDKDKGFYVVELKKCR